MPYGPAALMAFPMCVVIVFVVLIPVVVVPVAAATALLPCRVPGQHRRVTTGQDHARRLEKTGGRKALLQRSATERDGGGRFRARRRHVGGVPHLRAVEGVRGADEEPGGR